MIVRAFGGAFRVLLLLGGGGEGFIILSIFVYDYILYNYYELYSYMNKFEYKNPSRNARQSSPVLGRRGYTKLRDPLFIGPTEICALFTYFGARGRSKILKRPVSWPNVAEK